MSPVKDRVTSFAGDAVAFAMRDFAHALQVKFIRRMKRAVHDDRYT